MGFKQKGFTLIELAFTLVIVSLISASFAPMIKEQFETQKIDRDSSYLKSISKAATKYIEDNYSSIMAVATPTKPALISIPMLVSTNYLQANTATSNGFGQNVCMLIKEPTPGKLQGLLVTEGGDAVKDLDLASYAGKLGGDGGMITSTNPTQIVGTGGSWSLPVSDFQNLVNDAGTKCDGSAGNVQLSSGHPVVALWFNTEDRTAGVLNRNLVPGRPELNRMNTDIDMNSNDVNNASKVNTSELNATTHAQAPTFLDSDNTAFYLDPDGTSNLNITKSQYFDPQTVVTAGTACSPNGRIAMDSTGKTLSCQSSIWKSAEGGGSSCSMCFEYWDFTGANEYHNNCVKLNENNTTGYIATGDDSMDSYRFTIKCP